MNVEEKRQHEKQVLTTMCKIYCKGNHGKLKDGKLCPECQELLDYALFRTDKCPFMETKTFCSNCKVHCYKPDMRDKIKAVMRYSGPRMILHHPVAAVRHLILTKREKRQLDKK